MAATTSSFVSDFHNLEGVMIGERIRNFQNLLRNKTILEDEVQSVIDNLQPKTYMENIFYIEILSHYKKTEPLLEILKCGHEAFVKRIMKYDWFFQEAFQNVSAEHLVNDVLPKMSYSVKIKLLNNKLSKILHEDKVDQVFDLVVKRYGLHIALPILSQCSIKRIEDILRNSTTKLSTNQLKIIYKKSPEVIKVYFDQHKQNIDKTIDRKLMTYIAQNNPTFFWELVERYEFNADLKMGRRTTKHLVSSKKNEIVRTPDKYIKYMRHETLVRHLNKQGVFNELYRNLFPKYIEDLNMYLPCNRLLQYYPKKYQFNLFSQTFTEVINEDIYSNISCLEDYFFKVIDDLTVRQTFAQRKFEENPKCDDYIVYYKPEECFNIIRNRIKLTTEIQERKRLLQLLIEACTINGIDFLEKVLKYFCERHQNDDKDIRYKILEEIDSKVELDQLKEIHWKYINKMFTIQKLHKENSPGLLLLTYIKFLYKNNRSEMEKRDATMELIKQQIDCGLWVLHDVASLKDPQIEKNILLDIIECLPGILKTVGKESEINFLQSKICVEIFNYNSRYPKQKIDILNNEALIEIVRRNLQEEYVSHQFQRNLVQLICKSNRNDIENEILNFYFEKTLTQFPVYKPLRWYLKYDPLVLVKNVHNVVKALPKVTRKRWFKFKQYSHLNLDKMIIGNCLKQLDDKDESDKTNLICPLSYMCNAEDYIRIMRERNIIPITPKLAIEDEEAKKMYPLQQEFARQFKNTEDPQNSLQILIDEFCQGDYLKVSLPSLYSIFHKSPENILKPYVKKIFENTAMSVKKHSLFLSYAVFDFSAVLEMLRKFENTNNDSLHKHVFAGLLKYFLKNPNDKIYKYIVQFMNSLKEHDKESLRLLVSTKIPNIYIASYVQNIWELGESFKKNAIPAGTNRFDALSALGLVDKVCIQDLPNTFCRKIIEHHFLTDATCAINSDIFLFVFNYLLYRNEDKSNFNFVFNLVSNYKQQYWSTNLTKRFSVHNFFKVFYKKAINTEVNLEFVCKFFGHWMAVFSAFETFEEFVLLSLLQLEKEADQNQELYAKKIVLFSEEVVSDFGKLIFSKYVAILVYHLNNRDRDMDICDFFIKILKYKTNTVSCILVMEAIFLKRDLFYNDKIRSKYRLIESIVKQVPDPNVKLYYSLFLKADNSIIS